MNNTHDAMTGIYKMTVNTNDVLTDSALYALCKKWGAEALEARRKFIGLLPEVHKRRLYERRNLKSIYHFAAELGGVGERLVDEVLRLEKRFEAMPTLYSALVKGEIGMSKLARIVSVAEVKNEAELCEKIRTLSRRAVDVFVKEMGEGRNDAVDSNSLFGNCVEEDDQRDAHHEAENQNSSQKPLPGHKSLSGQNFDYEILATLSPEVKTKLKEFIDKEIDINSILLVAFAKREAEIAEKKAEIGETSAKSRYIPAQTRRIIKEEFGSKCSYRNCKKQAEQIHHEKPFAKHHDHNPSYLKPLCRGHHELEHVL
jgi:hypothetical protein